jgi:hypothetical protein
LEKFVANRTDLDHASSRGRLVKKV